jgi:hypothetical protein
MNSLFLFFLICQPVVPDLPELLDLPAPTKRPIVVPLEYDTISLGMYLGNSLGFDLIARYDTTSINGRAYIKSIDRRDHFQGVEQQGVIDIIYSSNHMQLDLNGFGVEYRQASGNPEQYETNYGTASLYGLWQKNKYLGSVEAGGYRSWMTGNLHQGAWVSSRFFLETPWARMLYKLSGRVDSNRISVVADIFGQRTHGSFLITPRVQLRYPFGASVGGTFLALLGRITLELDGDLRRFSPVVLDTFLNGPVSANIEAGTDPWFVKDHLKLGIGYSGVNVEVFLENGDKLYWQKMAGGIPELTSNQLLTGGIDAKLRLEHKNLSNYGGARVLFAPPGEVWEPQWLLSDSLTLYKNHWGSFIVLTAGGERYAPGDQDDAYALIDLGVYYQREPFRVLLRADDLLDRRPFRWPGLADPGRRISLVVGLFSCGW